MLKFWQVKCGCTVSFLTEWTVGGNAMTLLALK